MKQQEEIKVSEVQESKDILERVRIILGKEWIEMNKIDRWKNNIVLNVTKYPVITLLIVAMYLSFLLTLGDLLK